MIISIMKKISVFITAAAILLGCSKIEEIAPPVQDETLIEGVSSGNLPDVILASGTQPPTMGNGVFDDCDLFSTSGRITVPSGCVSAYSSATNWSTYANKIN